MIDRRSFVLGAAGLGSVSGFAAAQAASGGISAADMPDDFDVVVAGGSCTGVFAALRAMAFLVQATPRSSIHRMGRK